MLSKLEKLPPETLLHIFSFLAPVDRIKARAVSKKIQSIVDDINDLRFPKIWPIFFTPERLNRLGHKLSQRVQLEELYLAIKGSLEFNNACLEGKNISVFKSILIILSTLPAEQQLLLTSILKEDDINTFLPEQLVHKVLFNLPSVAETFFLQNFTEEIKNKIDSGWDLTACLGNVQDKERLLSIFSLTDLYHLSNEVRIRYYTEFTSIKAKLLQLSALEEIERLIHSNEGLYPLELLNGVQAIIKAGTCLDSPMVIFQKCNAATGVTPEQFQEITQCHRIEDVLEQQTLFPDDNPFPEPYRYLRP